ncbi:unnamed protein product, partial [Mesorhabditis spiculigera]
MFAISRLPEGLISMVLEQLAINELILLQRVVKKFRKLVNARWLLPRKLRTVSVLGRAHKIEEEVGEKGDPHQLLTHDVCIALGDRDGYMIRVHSHDHIYLMSRCMRAISVSKVPFALFLEHLPNSYFSSHSLFFTITEKGFKTWGYDAAQSQNICRQRLDDVSPFLRSLNAAYRIEIRVADNSTLRKIALNYQSGGRIISIWSADNITRCRECQERDGTEIPSKCRVCEDVWSGWREKGCKSAKRQQKIRLHTEETGTRVIGRLADVAFNPARVHRVLYEILTMCGDDQQDSAVFLQSFKKRLQLLHSGDLQLVDKYEGNMKEHAKWIKEAQTADGSPIEAYYFRIRASGKDYRGALLCNKYKRSMRIFDR